MTNTEPIPQRETNNVVSTGEASSKSPTPATQQQNETAAAAAVSPDDHCHSCPGSNVDDSSNFHTSQSQRRSQLSRSSNNSVLIKSLDFSWYSCLDPDDDDNVASDTTPPSDRRGATKESAPPLLKPAWVSQFIVLLNCSLGVTSFLIVLPTSANYTSSFQINEQLAGLLVGLSPLINGLMQPVLIPIFQRFRLQHIFYANCLLTMLGNTLYALGDVTNSFGILLFGRCILGVSGGPAFATTYTARATSNSIRTQYMGYVSVSVSSGYVFGPLLAFVSEAIVQAADWDSELLNSNTLPGWIVVIGAIFNLVLFVLFFEEPPRPSKSTQVQSKDSVDQSSTIEEATEAALEEGEAKGTHNDEPEPAEDSLQTSGLGLCFSLKGLQIAVCYLFIGVTMVNTGSFEISLVFTGEDRWDFSISKISLLLAAFNVVVISASFLNLERYVSSDRTGILVCFLGLLAGTPFLFNYGLARAGELPLVIIGGLVILYSAQTAKGFLFGLASKVPSPENQQTVVSFMATAYTFGRFFGTLVAPFLFEHEHAYGGFLLGINLVCCALFWMLFDRMGTMK